MAKVDRSHYLITTFFESQVVKLKVRITPLVAETGRRISTSKALLSSVKVPSLHQHAVRAVDLAPDQHRPIRSSEPDNSRLITRELSSCPEAPPNALHPDLILPEDLPLTDQSLLVSVTYILFS